MSDIRAVFLDAKKNRDPKVLTISTDCDALCQLIRCDTIATYIREIKGKPFRIICDDNGLIKGTPEVSAMFNSGTRAFVNNLVIVSPETSIAGDFKGLTKEDCDLIVSACEETIFMDENGVHCRPLLKIDDIKERKRK